MVADTIYRNVHRLPEPLQAQVFDFVEFLLLKAEREDSSHSQETWRRMSLDMAMRGMEAEMPNYTLADVKETFE